MVLDAPGSVGNLDSVYPRSRRSALSADIPHPFRLIRGGRATVRTAGVEIVVAPPTTPPFTVDAVVREEDSFLVLSADPVIREPVEHPLRVTHQVHETEPLPPGTVAVRSGAPLELLAVVHDLAREPTWREGWVRRALDGVLREAGQRHLTALALPVLGAVHGHLPAERFAALLVAALGDGAPRELERLWVQAAKAVVDGVLEALETAVREAL